MGASGTTRTGPAWTMMIGAGGPGLRAGAVLLVGALLAAPLGGCGRKVLRSSDVASADYYTKDEFRHLSEQQREEYCAELAEEFDIQAGRKESAEKRRAEEAARLQSAAARAQELLAEIGRLDRSPAVARPPVNSATTASTYAVRPGDSLWRIAERTWGDGRRWSVIHEANRSRLRDPDLLPVGTELNIPGKAASAAPGEGGS